MPGVSTQGPSWGYLKVNFSETLSIFGDKRPRNGSKNGEMAPRTGMGYPHIGVCVGVHVAGQSRHQISDFPTRSVFPAELPAHTPSVVRRPTSFDPERLGTCFSKPNGRQCFQGGPKAGQTESQNPHNVLTELQSHAKKLTGGSGHTHEYPNVACSIQRVPRVDG